MTENANKPTSQDGNDSYANRHGTGQPYSAPVLQVGQMRLNIDTARAPGYVSERQTNPSRPNTTSSTKKAVPQLDVIEHEVALERPPGFRAALGSVFRKWWR